MSFGLRKSYLSVGVLAMMVMRGRSSPEVPHRAGGAQLEAGNAHRDIESGLSLEAQRLQREGILRAAHQRIGVAADHDRGAGSKPAVVAGKIAGADPARGREHRPTQCRLLREADIEADPPHQPIVRVACTAVRSEPALQLVHRAHDEARAPGSAAFENPGLNPGLARGRRAGCGNGRTCERTHHGYAFHGFYSPSVRTLDPPHAW